MVEDSLVPLVSAKMAKLKLMDQPVPALVLTVKVALLEILLTNAVELVLMLTPAVLRDIFLLQTVVTDQLSVSMIAKPLNGVLIARRELLVELSVLKAL